MTHTTLLKEQKEPERLLSKVIFKYFYVNHVPLEEVLKLAGSSKSSREKCLLDPNTAYYICYRRKKNYQDATSDSWCYYKSEIVLVRQFLEDNAEDRFVTVETAPAAKDEFANYTDFRVNLYGIAWYIYAEPRIL